MSRCTRSLVSLLVASIMVAALAALWGGVGLGAARADGDATSAATVILVGQKPRFQQFFPGDDATFTVGITNTGTVALQTVAVTNATTPSCNRTSLGPLEPGQSTSYSCTRTDVDASLLNELEAVGTSEGGVTDSHVADAFVKVLSTDIRITKQPRTQTLRLGATADFTVIVFNQSPDLILTNIKVDDTVVDDCDFDPTVPVNLGPGQSFDYECEMSSVQSAVTSVATARADVLGSGDTLIVSDVAWVEVMGLEATLTPTPNSVAEPGGPVTFNVNLVNSGSTPLTLTGLTTNQFGNILDAGNDQVDPAHNTCLPLVSLPTIPPYGGNYACSFVATASGQPSDFSVILTATGRDRTNQTVTATTSATVRITNVPAAMNVTATADPPFIHPPGRNVTYSVRVDNTGEADTLTLTQLSDSLLGGLDGRGSCDVPRTIQPGFGYQCEFTTFVSGSVGQQKSRIITATARDDDLSPHTITDSTTVTVSITDLPTQSSFMPNVVDTIVGNSCVDAFPLSLNRQYSFLPPAKGAQSVFRFTLPRSGSVTVQMTNFVPRAGQLVVWSGQCGFLQLVGRNPDTALNKTVELGTRPAGPYIIQIINDGPTNTADVYRLLVDFD